MADTTLSPEHVIRNYHKVLETIESAAKKSGRDPSDITLVGVTKRIETERILPAVKAGLKIIGEVMGTDFKRKYDDIVSAAPDLTIHVIGNIQRNKVKMAVTKCHLIQSVKTEKILAEVNKRAEKLSKRYPIFLQIDVSDVEQKKGLTIKETLVFLKKIEEQYHNVVVEGFMTIAPLEYETTPSLLRKFFAKTYREFKEKLAPLLDIETPHLSMGMSSDYVIAIEEGATMVRIGTAIFGPRYK